MGVMDGLAWALARPFLSWQASRRLPVVEGRLRVPGISARAEVVRDRWGVPHIYAATETDLMFAQGFVHAQDRLWQMELNRRLAAGRLSELFGPIALDTDRLARVFGFREAAAADLSSLDSETRGLLEAYAAGVNAHLDHRRGRRPLEFSLLRHRPERWAPLDSMAFARYMTWALAFGWYGELVRARVAERVGPERAAELETEYPAGNAITLPAGIEFNALDDSKALGPSNGPFMQRGGASNAWAISGSRTASGKPLLANDPHLPLRMPAVWYQNHLVGGELNVTGVSFAGVPGVVIGHNDCIAWGVTVAFTDCQDLFMERFADDGSERYQDGDEWLEADTRDEAIRVRGFRAPHVERVLSTRHGPVVPDIEAPGGERVAIASSALRPNPDVRGFLRLNRARGWDEFVDAVRDLRGAQVNLVYADVAGNIGYRLAGAVPVRAGGDGALPSEGWTDDHDWIGDVPFDEMPQALNPERGFVVSANNRLVGDEYPHFLGSTWAAGYRATRIESEIERLDSAGIGDSRRMQLDLTSLPGLEFAALLDGHSPTGGDAALAAGLLRAWDGRLTADSAAGAVYQVARYRALRNLLEPTLGPELTTRIMGDGAWPLMAPESEYVGNDTAILLRLLGKSVSESSWWVEQAGGRSELLNRSLSEAAGWLREQLGDDPARWRWGDLHHIVFSHVMGPRKPLDRLLNRGPYAVGGDIETPCMFAFSPGSPYEASSTAPGYRQIIDLGDLSRSVSIIAPGQSGQPGSRHYDDLIEPWLEGEYHPMLWTREQVDAEAEATLLLEPDELGLA